MQSLDQVKNNVRHGISKRYSEDGSLVQILRFKNGEQINKTIIYYKDCFDNDEEEFSAGIGDEQMDVIKVELYEDETETLIQTTDP